MLIGLSNSLKKATRSINKDQILKESLELKEYKELKDNILNLVKKNKIEKALQCFCDFSDTSVEINSRAVDLVSKFNANKEANLTGMISQSSCTNINNEIRTDFLKLLGEVERLISVVD